MSVEFHVRPRARGAKSFTFVTDLDRILVGRGEVCDVRLPHPHVSFHHATIQRATAGWEITDHGSTNGTWVRGRRVHAGESVRLQNGDRVALPGFLLDVKFSPGTSTGRTADPDAIGREIYRSLLRPDLGEQEPRLEIDAGPLTGRMLTLAPREQPYLIGREPSCDWEIPDREASREHVAVFADGRAVRAADHASKNGIRVNGQLVREATLADGDTLEVGRTVLVFRDPRGAILAKLSRETAEPTELVDSFEEMERGDESSQSSVPPPPSSSSSAPPGGAGTPVPGGRPPADLHIGPPTPKPTPGPPTPPATPGRDVADLLTSGSAPPSVARRETRVGKAPDGTDTLIVGLGIVVFVVCLIAIYLLLR
ncbi:MAG: FHA domain-containing protein [Deltaproteobacteria bacterium]|nr:FHA domain-containing protein [Deltaproteobacteria bacterium]